MTTEEPPTRRESKGSQKRTRARSVKLFIRDIVIIFLAAIIISVGVKAFLVRSFYIPSGSMENTRATGAELVRF